LASHLVDGVPLPDAVGGHPALDFCNTRAGWGTARPKEYLTEPGVVALWCQDAGLLPPDTVQLLRTAATGEPAAAFLRRTLAFRDALYAVTLGRRDGAEWDLVAQEARRARAAGVLEAGAPGRPARWVLPGTSPEAGSPDPELPLLAVAGAAADLLTGPAATSVSACPGQGCGWLFSDPRGRRRWCTMAICGNRAKARRHAQRRRDEAS
jgi:predicted RNA-binding Zn ribbon-like protein